MKFLRVAMVVGLVALATACPPTVTPPGSTATVTVGGETITVSVPAGSSVAVSVADPSTLPPVPAGLEFPLGSLDIDVSDVALGAVVQVAILLETPAISVRKLVAGSWDPFADDGTTGATLSADGRTITVRLQDGGRGDTDGVVNGVIVDPISPVGSSGTATTTTSTSTSTTTTTTTTIPAPPGVVAMAAGTGHTCAVVVGGKVKCWGGGNGNNELGGGTPFVVSNVPVDVIGVDGATAVAAGDGYTCALVAGGAAKCWGLNSYGQKGNGITFGSTEVSDVIGLTGAVSISASGHTTCAVLAGGSVKCWGSRFYPFGSDTSPADVVGLAGATAVTVSRSHACAIVAGGAVRCWGSQNYGQLGDGVGSSQSATPVTVVGVTGATAIAAGGQHTCAVVAGGAVKCWGANQGSLGDGTVADSFTAVDVAGMSNAIAIGADGYGGRATCAVITGGTVKCWGYSSWAGNNSSTPVVIDGLTEAVSVVGGGLSNCVANADGTVRCWGMNGAGNLGNGTLADIQLSPVVGISSGTTAVESQYGRLAGATSVSVGQYSACAVVAAGKVKCWGSNNKGQLGKATLTSPSAPVEVQGIVGAVEVSVGSEFACARLAGGTVKCWGDNSFGHLGRGSIGGFSGSAAAVSGISGAVQLSVGQDHACVRMPTGALRCWGYNAFGQLGDGTTEGSAVPVDVNDVSDSAVVAAGGLHTCTLSGAGAVRCWGYNPQGELGNGTVASSSVPVAVAAGGVVGAIGLSSGPSHVCSWNLAQVSCWGSNSWGEVLGGGATNPRTSPGIQNIAASQFVEGDGFTCVRFGASAPGGVACQGVNYSGQMGIGSEGATGVIADQVLGVVDATSVSAGFDGACATVTNGEVKCWGSGYGSTPVPVLERL